MRSNNWFLTQSLSDKFLCYTRQTSHFVDEEYESSQAIEKNSRILS